ncbi:hypothetical protein ACRAKI_21245 [Saccharothrix isguenensis]
MRLLLTTAAVTAAGVLALVGNAATASAEPVIDLDLSHLVSNVAVSTDTATAGEVVVGGTGVVVDDDTFGAVVDGFQACSGNSGGLAGLPSIPGIQLITSECSGGYTGSDGSSSAPSGSGRD